MNAYELNGVRHWYQDRCVVAIPEMDVHQGEVLAIVGPSGAGKSTLLRLLNFLEQPTEGSIVHEGVPVSDDVSMEVKRRVTTVFQHPVLLRRSVRTNLQFGLKLRNEKRPEADLNRWLDALGLTDLSEAPARTLSAGEAQRVALARALIVEPSVLLLDEPTANLDPYNVGLIEDMIRRINAERATTIVLVTHNIFQARRLADRTGLLIGGELIEVAATERFFSSPGDHRTAAFVRGDLVY
ncbi:MAG: phosphate ABC transporter ATP-binding protein [Acidimicrobiia bacterium]|nr:phosphate ABC transporter ATP-binding protein [Acidimicrobiia bacterium]